MSTTKRTPNDPAADDHRRLEALMASVARDLGALVTRMPRLIERDHMPVAPDGFPRSASGADRSTPATRPVLDHDELEEARLPDHSDPTGEAAAAAAGKLPHDPVSKTVRAIWRRLDDAATDLLRAAEMARNLAAPAGGVELEHPWCTRHHLVTRPDGERVQRTLAWRKDKLRWAGDRLCSFCGEYREAHGELPPLALLEHLEKHPGARLTPALVARFQRNEEPPAERSSRKRKRGWHRA